MLYYVITKNGLQSILFFEKLWDDFQSYVPIAAAITDMKFSPLYLYVSKKYLPTNVLFCESAAKQMEFRKDFLTVLDNPNYLWQYVDYGYNTTGIGDDFCRYDKHTDMAAVVPLRPGQMKRPSEKIVFGDSVRTGAPKRGFWSIDIKKTVDGKGEGYLMDRHSHSANMVMLDGHAKNVKDALKLIHPSSPEIINSQAKEIMVDGVLSISTTSLLPDSSNNLFKGVLFGDNGKKWSMKADFFNEMGEKKVLFSPYSWINQEISPLISVCQMKLY